MGGSVRFLTLDYVYSHLNQQAGGEGQKKFFKTFQIKTFARQSLSLFEMKLGIGDTISGFCDVGSVVRFESFIALL